MAGDIGITERVVILAPETGAESVEAAAPETRIIHRYGPRVMIGEAPPPLAGEESATPEASAVAEDLDPIGALGLEAFALRQSPEYAAAKARRPHDGQPWDGEEVLPPDPPEHLKMLLTQAPARETHGGAEAAAGQTSEQMTGSIAVGIIIVSGPTPDLQFSAAETQQVIAEVQNGLGWLAAQNPAAGIVWTYDIHSVNVNVQPGGGGNKEDLWRNPAMAALGYAANFNGVYDYVDHIRAQYATQWTYVAYFTKYPVDWFAYASIGGPRLVMQYANDGWGPDQIDRVFAHETGHVFQAPDEYEASDCTCDGSWGIFNQPNGNCETCAAGGGVDCIMRSNSWAMCTYTPWHYGFPLASPGTFYVTGNAGISIGSAPGAAVFNGKLYAAFQANDPSHTLYVTSTTWAAPAAGYPGIAIGSAPALAVFNGRLYAAFQANDSSHTLYVTRSSDGNSWTTPAVGYPGIAIGGAPAMAAFNGRLYIAFQANDPSHMLYVTSSSDGNNWTTPAVGYPGIAIGGAPAMAAFNGRLYIAFQANDSSHTLYITSSSDGNNWTTPAVQYPGIAIGGTPAMAVWNGNLYLAFQANDSSHLLYMTGTADGQNLISPALRYPTISIGSTPALANFNGWLFIAFQANDSSNILYTGGFHPVANLRHALTCDPMSS